MEEDRAVLRLRRMPAEGASVPRECWRCSRGITREATNKPWPVTVDGTEITIRRDDWDMDRLYGKALAFGGAIQRCAEALPGITGAGFIT